ncbi:MAG: arginine repressor [Oscillospiraceae bacterium]|nr:arginine repressor [Oscillospiraceae bacterium]
MKNDRQEKILAIIASEPIETQEQLIARLKEHGVTSTQATISRDIKQLHLIKEPAGGGRYRYAVSAHRAKLSFADRLQTILRESIVGVDYAQNLVVLKTMPGLAGAAAAAFDGMEIPQMVGTIAGDDTVLVVMRDTDSAADFCAEVAAMRK